MLHKFRCRRERDRDKQTGRETARERQMQTKTEIRESEDIKRGRLTMREDISERERN